MLDTDGVNAFAAPGGFIHITRGALGLIGNEAELAGVLAHEITHVTEKHTIKAIQKSKMMQMGANETLGRPGGVQPPRGQDQRARAGRVRPRRRSSSRTARG